MEFPEGNLLLITTDYPPETGGVAWYYHNLVRRLNADTPTAPSPFLGGGHVEVLRLGKWAMTPLWPFMLFYVILKSLKFNPDYWWVGQALPVGTVVWLLTFVWRKPYIVSTHGMDILLPLKSKRKQWLVKKILHRAELITANSEWTKNKIMEHYFSENREQGTGNKFVVVYPEPKPKRNVAQDEVFALREKLGIPQDAKVALSVGRLVKRKGIDRVIGALPQVWKNVPALHYVIVGEGSERARLQELASSFFPLKARGSEEGVMNDDAHNSPDPSYLKRGSERDASRIHLAGGVTDEGLAVYYTMADMFVLLPREEQGDAEGFGIVYLEANQYALPIVGCVSGGTGEALNKCRNAHIVTNADDTREAAQAIIAQAQHSNSKVQM